MSKLERSSRERRMYRRIRNCVGYLGVILPWIALFSAGICEHPGYDWWWSISATYYQTFAIAGVLVPASIVLITYIGYDALDNWITTLSGIFGLGVVLFPCKVSWIPNGTPVGFFHVPIEISHILHTCCASLFFLLIAFNSIFLFTKSIKSQTKHKRIRNNIYRICGWSMIGLEIFLGITKLIGAPGYWTLIIEIPLLNLFGIAWLVKGETFKFLNDTPEEKEKQQALSRDR